MNLAKTTLTMAIICIVALATPNCKKKKDGATEETVIGTMYVTANGGLRMRSQPSTKGKKVGLYPRGTEVKILKKETKMVKIGDKNAVWMKVRAGKRKGWMYSGYLADEKPEIEKKTGKYHKLASIKEFKAGCLLNGGGGVADFMGCDVCDTISFAKNKSFFRADGCHDGAEGSWKIEGDAIVVKTFHYEVLEDKPECEEIDYDQALADEDPTCTRKVTGSEKYTLGKDDKWLRDGADSGYMYYMK